MAKEETLLIPRSYQAHPTCWSEVLDDVRENIMHLPTDTRDLYKKATLKQLRDRISSKFWKLLSCDTEAIQDIQIRTEVLKIKAAEKRLVQSTGPVETRAQAVDRRDAIVQDLSDSDDQQPPVDVQQAPVQQPDLQPRPKPRPGPAEQAGAVGADQPQPRRRPPKRSLASLTRENQVAYNKFITRKVPKLLRELGISSSDEDDL